MKPSFLAELQRRHVDKVGAAYAVGGWLLVQVITQVLPIFHVSEIVQRVLVLIVIAGFPVALVLAWIFDVTPRGIVRTPELPEGGDAPVVLRERRGADRKLNLLLGALLLLALLYFIAERTGSFSRGNSADDKSIAVLPFENLSDDKGNGYFATGIQDEILTRLAKLGALRVIARASTERFGAHPSDLKAIASQLGVGHLVLGSVQKVGEQVRVNVQLLRASDETPLWAEIYDRRLDDILGVQGEVASAIAAALDARISGRERTELAAKPTLNAAAYDAYLRGLNDYRSTFSPLSLKSASRHFAEAVALDPAFTLAWVYGSLADGFLWFQAFDHSAERLGAARRGADMALKLAPDSGEAQLAKGFYLYRTLDFDGASAALEEALRRLPNNAEVIGGLGFIERRRGHYERAIELLTQALEKDPGNLSLISGIAETLGVLRRTDEARDWLGRALQLRPGDPALIAQTASLWLIDGKLDEAGRLLEPLPVQVDDPPTLGYQLNYRHYRHDYAGMIEALRSAMAAPTFVLDGWTSNYYATLGWAQRWAGDDAGAQATFAAGRAQLRALRERWDDNGYLASNLGLIEAGLGHADAALAEARRSIELVGRDVFNRAGLEVVQAQTQAAVGHRDEAIATLIRLERTPAGPALIDLRLSPFWDSLRGDPRFQRLIADGAAQPRPATKP